MGICMIQRQPFLVGSLSCFRVMSFLTGTYALTLVPSFLLLIVRFFFS